MQNARVLISILNWNGGDTTLDCLRSVSQLEYPCFDVAVLDNGSVDDSPRQIRQLFPAVRLIQNPTNLGFAGGHNLVIAHGLKHRFDYFWILNNDAVVSPDSLGRIVGAMDANPRVGLASPVIYFRDEPDGIQFCGSWLDWGTHEVRYSRSIDEICEREQTNPESMCLWGTAMMLSRGLVEQVGVFDERYFAYYEDTELSLRSTRAGFLNKMVADARTWHRSPVLTRDRPAHFFYCMTRNGYWFWHAATHGLDRLRAQRRHLARALRQAGKCRDDGLEECMRACVLGFRDGIAGRPGAWDPLRRPTELLTWAFAWHPYLLASLLEGELARIGADLARRVRG